MIVLEDLEIEKKLEILSAAAKDEVYNVYAAGTLRADDPVLSAQLYRGALFELGDQAFAG